MDGWLRCVGGLYGREHLGRGRAARNAFALAADSNRGKKSASQFARRPGRLNSLPVEGPFMRIWVLGRALPGAGFVRIRTDVTGGIIKTTLAYLGVYVVAGQI